MTTSFKEAFKPFADKLRLAATLNCTVQIPSDMCEDVSTNLDIAIGSLDDRTIHRLHWAEIALIADVHSVYFSGIFVGMLLGFAIGYFH
jgi:hypothetical protein